MLSLVMHINNGISWDILVYPRISVSETKDRREAVSRSGSKRGRETRLRREAAACVNK